MVRYDTILASNRDHTQEESSGEKFKFDFKKLFLRTEDDDNVSSRFHLHLPTTTSRSGISSGSGNAAPQTSGLLDDSVYIFESSSSF